jgi:Tol biopolymer transport system component
VQGPRHWLRSSPDGSRIAFLAKDKDGIVQFWTVSPNGTPAEQLTRNPWPVASAFSWSPDGAFLACVMDGSIFLTDAQTGQARRLTTVEAESPPRPEACVFSPDGKSIAFVRRAKSQGKACNQIYTLRLDR